MKKTTILVYHGFGSSSSAGMFFLSTLFLAVSPFFRFKSAGFRCILRYALSGFRTAWPRETEIIGIKKNSQGML